jgi:hypothetical protein
MYLRSKRAFQVGAKLPVKIEAPGVGFSLSLETRVLLSQEGFVGLEALSFREKVLPTLELMVQAASGGPTRSPSTPPEAAAVEGEEDSHAKTMVGPLPAGLDFKAERKPPPRDSTVVEAEPRGAMARPSLSPSVVDSEATFNGETEESDPSDEPGTEDLDMGGLSELDRGIAQVSAQGLYEPRDTSELLGRYLAELKHGHLSTVGGPTGEVGDEIRLEIAMGDARVLLTGSIIARAGKWRMLHLPETSEVATLLASHKREIEKLITHLLNGTPSAASEPEVERPRSSVAPPSRPSIAPPAAPARSTPPAPAAAARAPSVETPEGPPRPARLEGDVVIFDQRADLTHEIDTNLKNGGLFVDASPLPIRTHKSLRFRVKGRDLPVEIEADVVFASGGKLGFSIPAFAEALTRLQAALDGAPVSIPPGRTSVAPGSTRSSEQPGDGGPNSVPPPPNDAALQEGLVGFSGKISAPLHRGDLLDLLDRRVKHPGGLGHVPALLLFEYLARHSLKGILELQNGEESKRVWLHNGSIAFVESKPWSEDTSLGRILIQNKLISDPALREGLERSRASGRSLGRVLTSLGHVKTRDLTQSLREQSRLKLDSAFSWTQGTFRWLAWDSPPTKADLVLVNGLGAVGRHIKHLFEQTTSADMEQLLENCMSRRIFVTDDFERLAPKLALNQKELRFVEVHIDGRQNFAEALKGSPLGRLASMRLLAQGLAMEIFALERSTSGSVVRKAPARSVTDTSGVRALKQRLEADLDRLKKQNHFEILGVHWTAHHRTYRAAYTQAAQQYDIKTAPLKDAPDDVKALARTLASKLDESFKFLSESANRAGYRKKLYDQTERGFTADMLVKQGEVMVMRGDRMGSIEAFETAVELSPTDRNKNLLARARAGRSDL